MSASQFGAAADAVTVENVIKGTANRMAPMQRRFADGIFFKWIMVVPVQFICVNLFVNCALLTPMRGVIGPLRVLFRLSSQSSKRWPVNDTVKQRITTCFHSKLQYLYRRAIRGHTYLIVLSRHSIT